MNEIYNFNTRFLIDIGDNRKGKIRNKAMFEAFIGQFPGQTLRIDLSIYEGKRTENQNNYYFGVVIPSQIKAHTEFHGLILNKTQMHEFNKANFFATEVYNPIKNSVLKIPTSSTIYDVKGFGHIIDLIVSYYRDNFNWEISPPNYDLI